MATASFLAHVLIEGLIVSIVLAAFALFGVLLGLFLRRWPPIPLIRAALGWLWNRRKIGIILLILAAAMGGYFVVQLPDAMHYPPLALVRPTYRPARMVAISYNPHRDRWDVVETVTFRLYELRGYTNDIVRPVAPKPWRPETMASDTADLEWKMTLRRSIRDTSSDQGLKAVENFALTPPTVPREIASVLNQAETPIIWTDSEVILRAPQGVVSATDPPAESTNPLPNDWQQFVTHASDDGGLTVEVFHPWMRNALARMLVDWNVWEVLKWLVVAVAALFSDKIREKVLAPPIEWLFTRKKRPRRAGFHGTA